MSATSTSGVLERGDALDLIAALRAAASLCWADGQVELNGVPRELLSEAVFHLATELEIRALGPQPGGDEWEADPLVVEGYARSCEFEAQMIDYACDTDEQDRSRHGRSAKLMTYAEEIRRQGTVNVQYPIGAVAS